MDNLNTHNAASLYETFEPQEARRLWRQDWTFITRRNMAVGSIAEIELSALKGQCLDRRYVDHAI